MQPIIRLFPYLLGIFLGICITLITIQFTLSQTAMSQDIDFQSIQTTAKILTKEQFIIDSVETAQKVGISTIDHTVDFDKQMLIGVTMGSRATGGYSIRITDVTETPDTIYVHTKQSKPDSGAPVTQAFTYPQDFVTIPKTDKRIVFLD